MKKEATNILLILADDLGLDDLGFAGNPRAATPVLDRLAEESVRFDDFTVNPVCAASRASLLTGRHFLRTGVSHVHGGKDFLHLEERTLADHLRSQGYATGLWGKWHLGVAPRYYPWQRGFDEAWMARLYKHADPEGLLNGQPVQHEGWADAVMVDYAMDFIERHADRPWFAYLPSMSPHGPLKAPEAFVAPHRREGHSENYAVLQGMISHLDHQLGRLFHFIETRGLAEDTLVIFLSDNGPCIEEAALTDADRAARKLGGRRGWKGDIWENGVRSPCLIRQGTRLPARRVSVPVCIEDLFPTVLEAAGLPVPAPVDRPLDGFSFAPLLRGQSQSVPRPIFNYANPGWPPGRHVYTPDGIRDEYRPVAPDEKRAQRTADQVVSIRRGAMKWLLNPDINTRLEDTPTAWLVDLANDPGERNNVAAAGHVQSADLRKALERWWESILDEPHAFQAPEFIFPTPESDTLHIPGKAPCQLGGDLLNTVHALKGWNKAGQFARYHLKVEHAVDVTVRLIFDRLPPGRVTWQLRHGKTRIETSHEGGSSNVIEFPQFNLSRDAGLLELAILRVNETPPDSDGWLNAIEIMAR